MRPGEERQENWESASSASRIANSLRRSLAKDLCALLSRTVRFKMRGIWLLPGAIRLSFESLLINLFFRTFPFAIYQAGYKAGAESVVDIHDCDVRSARV